MLCLYHSYTLSLAGDLVFLLLFSMTISLLLDLSGKKEYRMGIYTVFILMCLIDPQYMSYMPLIIYNMSIDLRAYTAITFIFIFLHFSPLNFITALLSVYLSARTDDYHRLLASTKSTHNALIEHQFHLRSHNEQLEKDSDKNIHIGILTERNRIARELHDSIGHVLSSSILQVEALKIISEDKNMPHLNLLQDTLSNGMEDIRHSIHNIYSDSLDLKGKIYELSDDFPALKIELIYKLSDDLPYALKFDILSIVKESMTNCAKHSTGTKLVINLLEQPRFYALIIKDNGRQFASHKNLLTKGMGMAAMKEMADKYGGSFNASFDQGFNIHITLMKGS